MAPSGSTHLDYTYAVLTSVGGMMGYAKAKSVPSLVGGFGLAAAYGTAGYLIGNVDAYVGHSVGAVTSFGMATVMGIRLIKTQKLMPAGLLAGAGVAGLVYHYRQMQDWAPA